MNRPTSTTRVIVSIAATILVAMSATSRIQAEVALFPLQLEMRVAFEPTAYQCDGRTYIAYEIRLTNLAGDALSLSKVEVFDDERHSIPIATIDGAELNRDLEVLGAAPPTSGIASKALSPGLDAVLFMRIAIDLNGRIPRTVSHRITTMTNSTVEGAVISTHHAELLVLAPPVTGTDWLAEDGMNDDPENHHRRGLLVLDGKATISRRYAIDWTQLQHGSRYEGDEHDPRSYYAYGKAVFAVADGTVLDTRDDIPDNPAGHGEHFHPAVPINMDTVGGNRVVLDLGHGEFAFYMHLQPRSLLVRAGDHVKRGQPLGKIGASGDAREPHLHFEVTNLSKPMAGEGLPYAIDAYQMKIKDTPRRISNALPLGGSVVEFNSGTRPDFD